jgi:hypothetical protein
MWRTSDAQANTITQSAAVIFYAHRLTCAPSTKSLKLQRPMLQS